MSPKKTPGKAIQEKKDVIFQSHQQLEKKASQARKKLMTRDYLYFGINLYKFKWDCSMSCPDKAGAYVLFNMKSGDLAIATIFINGHLLARPDFTHLNLSWYLLHELLHILNGHGMRSGNKELTLWNFATDHVIECFLKDLRENEINKKIKNIIVPYGGIENANIIEELQQDLPNCNAEDAYEWILSRRNQFEISSVNNKNGNGDEDGEETNGDDSNKFVKITDKKTGKEYIIANPNLSLKDKRQEKQAQAEARAAWDSIKERGDQSSFIKNYLDKILKVEIPWTDLVKKAIKQTAIIKPTGRSWRNINKYYAPHGLTLPGVEYEEENDGIGTLIVGVDVSGSVSTIEQQQFAGIIIDSIKYFKTIIVMVHDVNVHQVLEYNKDNILDFGKMLKETGFQGGGGTSHNPLFGLIDTVWKENSDNISMVISLTDGYSDVENEWDKFEWSVKNQIPTYFIITMTGTLITPTETQKFENIKINVTE